MHPAHGCWCSAAYAAPCTTHLLGLGLGLGLALLRLLLGRRILGGARGWGVLLPRRGLVVGRLLVRPRRRGGLVVLRGRLGGGRVLRLHLGRGVPLGCGLLALGVRLVLGGRLVRLVRRGGGRSLLLLLLGWPLLLPLWSRALLRRRALLWRTLLLRSRLRLRARPLLLRRGLVLLLLRRLVVLPAAHSVRHTRMRVLQACSRCTHQARADSQQSSLRCWGSRCPRKGVQQT